MFTFANIVLLSVLMFFSIGCFNTNKHTYKLELLSGKEIVSIKNSETTITDSNEMNEIIKIVYCDGEGRKTSNAFPYEYPANAEKR